jgi:hypothetical protein
MLFLLFKLLTVLVFLIAFLRRPTLVWGIGLLAVTAAVLLDTILGTFGREEMIARIGFFFYVISGFIFSGAALWLWGLLRPQVDAATIVTAPTATTPPVQPQTAAPPALNVLTTNSESAVDYNMLFQEIKKRFSREDVLDLMFDLDLDESEVMPVNQDMTRLIVNIIDRVAERGQGTALALAVERILTPPAPEKLPRLEKLTAESPPTILRQYLLAHFDMQQLQEAAASLNIDWENLSGSHKPAKARELLHYLQRRNRLDELINWLHQSA